MVLPVAEAAFAWHLFSVVSEYHAAIFEREPLQNLDFQRWDVHGTWSVTGESRAAACNIDSGEFRPLQPAHDFNLEDSTWVAWEPAVRHAQIDLDDGSVTGVKQVC